MDFNEIKCLAEMQDSEAQDLSLMLNFERSLNGASKQFLNQNMGGL